MPLKRDQDFRKGFFLVLHFLSGHHFFESNQVSRTYRTVTLTVFELRTALWEGVTSKDRDQPVQIWHWLICLVFYLETIHKRSFLVFRRDFFSIFRAWGLNKIALTGVFFFCVQSKSRIFTLKLILKWICRLLNIILWVQKNRFDWT